MKVHPCPICGNMPKIKECMPHKGERRRMCLCTRYDAVIPYPDHINRPWFVYFGDGDDNAIFKLWNAAVERYNKNKTKNWFDRDYTPWANSSHLEKNYL